MSEIHMEGCMGFTGSRNGMTTAQKRTVWKILNDWGDALDGALHGGCVGADEEFEEICDKIGIRVTRFPASDVNTKWVSKKEPVVGTEIKIPAPAMTRNHFIVDNAWRMIATPKTAVYQKATRSGSWATIRMTYDANKRLYLVLPDGLVDYF